MITNTISSEFLYYRGLKLNQLNCSINSGSHIEFWMDTKIKNSDHIHRCKKSLKIIKGYPEAINQRRTGNTMTNNDLQNTTQKTIKLSNMNPIYNGRCNIHARFLSI